MIAPKEWPSSTKPVEPERIRQQLDIAREAIERECRGIDALRAALAALVDVQNPVLTASGSKYGRNIW